MPPGPRDWKLEQHTVHFEPPDVFWTRFHGPLTLDHARGALAIYQEMSEVRPFIFVAELDAVGRLDPEAARFLSENLPMSWVVGNIYIGGRLLHRALAKGLALASRLSSHSDDKAIEKIHHVATAAEARALIPRLRARHAEPTR
ncbi:hypothetical protein [Melittangium boletus]|uniref:hypothetical protein n=1 Tax=Melittangium boletus TaxID=83453 RepID=UPI003DA5F76A